MAEETTKHRKCVRAISFSMQEGIPCRSELMQDDEDGDSTFGGKLGNKPSMVDIDGSGQSIAVLTSGGDAQGKFFLVNIFIVLHHLHKSIS